MITNSPVTSFASEFVICGASTRHPRHDVDIATLLHPSVPTDMIVVSVERAAKFPDRYELRVAHAAGELGAPIPEPTIVVGRDEAVRTVRRMLDRLYTPGDSIAYSSVVFSSVDDVIHELSVALAK